MKQYDATLKIAVCEDEKQEQQALGNLLEDYFSAKQFHYTITYFPNGTKLLKAFEKQSFSLVFMDIFLQNENGMETARALRRKKINTPIIFTTTSHDYAIDSYEVAALYYLVKPVSPQALEAALSRYIKEDDARYLEIVSERETIPVLLHDILYAEAFGNQIILHTASGDIPTYQSLDILARDAGPSFLRCHRSFLVNMDAIHSVDKKEFILCNGLRVPIRINGRAEAVQAYNHHFIESVRGQA